MSIATWSLAFVATHVPSRVLPESMPADSMLHFAGYLVLGGLLLLTTAGYYARPVRRAILVACALVLYASVDELTQAFVNRDAAVTDWIADVGGAITAVVALEIIFALVARRRRKAMMRDRSERVGPRFSPSGEQGEGGG